jgi:hypothetical protein
MGRADAGLKPDVRPKPRRPASPQKFFLGTRTKSLSAFAQYSRFSPIPPQCPGMLQSIQCAIRTGWHSACAAAFCVTPRATSQCAREHDQGWVDAYRPAQAAKP